jgi:hypothetical protein
MVPPSNSKCISIFIVCFADHWKEMRFREVDWIGKKEENLIDKWEAKWLRSIKSLSFYDCINNVKWDANFPLVRLKWITLNIQLENRVNSQMGNDFPAMKNVSFQTSLYKLSCQTRFYFILAQCKWKWSNVFHRGTTRNRTPRQKERNWEQLYINKTIPNWACIHRRRDWKWPVPHLVHMTGNPTLGLVLVVRYCLMSYTLSYLDS